MKRKLIIQNKFGCWDNSADFVITNNEDFEIEFENLIFSGQAFLIGNLHGKKFTKQIQNNSVILEKEYIRSGVLKCKIEIRSDDLVDKTISIEDLRFANLDKKITTIPQIEELNNEIKKYNLKVEKLSADIETLLQVVNVLAETDLKIGE